MQSRFWLAIGILLSGRMASAEPPQEATLILQIPPAASETVLLTLDGAVVDARNTVVRVAPGHHTLTIHWRGFSERAIDLDLRAGEQRIVDAGPQQNDPRSKRRKVGWVLAGVGASAITAAIVTGVMVRSTHDDYERHCPNAVCDPMGLDAASSGRSLLVLNGVAWGIGIASASIATWLLWPRHERDRTTIALSPSSQGCVMAVSGRF